MNNKIVLGIIGGFVAIVLGICIYEVIIADKKGPVISFSDNELTYTEGQDDSILLDDVKAVDSRDGDVSSTIMIAEKVILNNSDTIKIIYAAKDKKHNITKKARLVKYIATGKTQEENNEVNDENTDQTDTTTAETTSAGPSDPTGEIDKAAADISGMPVIKLKAVEATITAGQTFDEISYVKETYDNSGDVSRRIRVDGTYDIAVPGDYQLKYLVSDKEGNISEPVLFTLHIAPAQTTVAQTQAPEQTTTVQADMNASAANGTETTTAPVQAAQ